MTSSGHPILWTALVLLAASSLCACDLVGDDGNKCGVVAPALINGSNVPGEVALSSDEQHAIVAIEDRAGALRCTGAVVEEERVMTAASCLGDGHVAARFHSGDVIPLEVVVSRYEGVVLLYNPQRALPHGVKPLRLSRRSITQSWVGHSATVAGFGRDEKDRLGSLHFIDEPITKITDSMIEVDGMGNRGACAGDLGAPLLVGREDDAPAVGGVLVEVSASCTGVDSYQRIDSVAGELDRVYGDDAGPFVDYGGC
jgi:hypothetical protein